MRVRLAGVVLTGFCSATVACAPAADQGELAAEEVVSTQASDTLTTIVPEPGATFVGEIDMQGTAESGSLEFQISEDGTQVAPGLVITLVGVEHACSAETGRTTTTLRPIRVEDGAFRQESATGDVLEGTFVSPTSARGKVHYVESDPIVGACDFGGTWTADVVAPEGAPVGSADEVAEAPVFRGSDPFVTVAITESGIAPELTETFFSEYGFELDAGASGQPAKIEAGDGRTLFWAFFVLERIEDVSVRGLTGKTRKEEHSTFVVDAEGDQHPIKFGTWRGIEYMDLSSLASPSRLTEGTEGLMVFSIPLDAEPVALSVVYSFTNEWEEGSKEKSTFARLEIPLGR